MALFGISGPRAGDGLLNDTNKEPEPKKQEEVPPPMSQVSESKSTKRNTGKTALSIMSALRGGDEAIAADLK